MKKFIILVVLLAPQLLFAQNNSSIDITTGINYSYRTLNNSSDESIFGSIYDSRNDREKGNLNWTAGIHFNKKIADAWHLRTGLRLTKIGYKITIDDPQWPSQHTGSGQHDPTIPSGEPAPDDILKNYLFIDLPISIRYEFNSNKLSPYIEIGLAPNYYIGETKYAYLEKFQLASIISGGINYSLSTIQLFVQPTFRFNLTKTADSDLKEHLYSGGLEIGLRKSFGPKAAK